VAEVLFIAGEASGDLHAAGVAEELGRLRPELKMSGIGGPRMKAAGVELFANYDEMSVMGFVEILTHLPRHFELLAEMRTRLEKGRASLLIVVDYPGFNMKVARIASEAGVPVLYYVTPQVWAWGAGRLPELAKIVTRAGVILPFEEELLRGYGVNATFVGHPLLDRAEAVFTILEHEAMHQETLLYMWHRLPFDRKRRPADYRPRVDGAVPAQDLIG